jgi:hypothetical protein
LSAEQEIQQDDHGDRHADQPKTAPFHGFSSVVR